MYMKPLHRRDVLFIMGTSTLANIIYQDDHLFLLFLCFAYPLNLMTEFIEVWFDVYDDHIHRFLQLALSSFSASLPQRLNPNVQQ